MPSTPTFRRITLEQFDAVLRKFPFSRRVNAVHMHHTWKPARADFRGHETIVGMWRYHTQTQGWSDIAQHITIDPEGMIWLGRNWNLPPASASGHNGNAKAGPFMFEMIGDFDRGRDPFDGPQRSTAIGVIARVQHHFNLPSTSLQFHNSMSAKSCPGTGISYEATLQEVEQARQQLAAAAPAATGQRSPFPDESALLVAQDVQALQRVTDASGEPADAEPDDAGHAHGREGPLEMPQDMPPRSSGLGIGELAALRPHIVNLRSGLFSDEGEVSTRPQDVDAIFEQHLPARIRQLPAAEKLRLVFFAHGGLVSEGSALQRAHEHVAWWLANGVYPVCFIWESGFFETIAQALQRALQGSRAATRDFWDHTLDPMIEATVRTLGGRQIWGAMKWSAQRASGPGGGAAYVAQKLQEFLQAHGKQVELHAIGHSAGAIFHSHFLPCTAARGVPPFESLHLLAPAIRTDAFKERLLRPGGPPAARQVTLYTMRREYERDDNCAGVYRKSLLYLIHHALEDRTRSPILGLEECLRADADLKSFFGLAGQAGGGEAIWSVTAGDSGRSASQATKHGDFDEDGPTMNSVLRRILGKADADPVIDYPRRRLPARSWLEEVDWPPGLQPQAPFAWQPAGALPAPAAPAWSAPSWSATPPPPPPLPAGGRRMALCVGIDAYPAPEHRLGGCVNDAHAWAAALRGLQFDVRLLLDGQATRAGLEQALRGLLAQSRPGDVLVFQFAGHGTHVADLDGDEADGRDEALCPVDFASGALFIDDDVAAVFEQLPAGVSLTCFTDCCHSGTNTRFAAGRSRAATALPAGARARFVPPTAVLEAAHRHYRRGMRSGSVSTGGREAMRHVKFSACRDDEVALESGGSGDFTLRAVRVLQSGLHGLTNAGFLDAVRREFGSAARQEPLLDCSTEARTALLLQPWAGGRQQVVAAGSGGLVQAVQALALAVQALAAAQPRP